MKYKESVDFKNRTFSKLSIVEFSSRLIDFLNNHDYFNQYTIDVGYGYQLTNSKQEVARDTLAEFMENVHSSAGFESLSIYLSLCKNRSEQEYIIVLSVISRDYGFYLVNGITSRYVDECMTFIGSICYLFPHNDEPNNANEAVAVIRKDNKDISESLEVTSKKFAQLGLKSSNRENPKNVEILDSVAGKELRKDKGGQLVLDSFWHKNKIKIEIALAIITFASLLVAILQLLA